MKIDLNEALSQLGEAKSLSEIQVVVRSSARYVCFADGATFVLRDGDSCFYLDEDAISPLWKGQRFPIGRCLSGWAMLHDEIGVVPDITTDARIPQEAYQPTFVKSMVMVPVKTDEPVGAMGVYWSEVGRSLDCDLGSLQKLADAVGQALGRVGLSGAPFLPNSVDQGG